MKKLKQFMKFDYERFFKNKTILFIDYKIEDSEKFKGAKVNLIVGDDRTVYGNDEVGINDLERFVLKIPGATEEEMKKFVKKEKVRLISVESCQVWGDYMNNLIVIGHLQKNG